MRRLRYLVAGEWRLERCKLAGANRLTYSAFFLNCVLVTWSEVMGAVNGDSSVSGCLFCLK